jgi:inorganic pyrophosphatase
LGKGTYACVPHALSISYFRRKSKEQLSLAENPMFDVCAYIPEGLVVGIVVDCRPVGGGGGGGGNGMVWFTLACCSN